MLRGSDFAQPRTLTNGDVLSNGWQVDGEPSRAVNSSVGIHFTNGLTRIVAPRLPLQLQSDRKGILPSQLKIGQILQTGCVVLDNPKPIGPVEWHGNQEEVGIDITGGWKGHQFGAPTDLELAVFEEMYPPRTDTLLGAFALKEALGMRKIARRNLTELGQLALEIR